MTSAISWDISQRIVVIPYRSFDPICSIFKEQEYSLHLKMGPRSCSEMSVRITAICSVTPQKSARFFQAFFRPGHGVSFYVAHMNQTCYDDRWFLICLDRVLKCGFVLMSSNNRKLTFKNRASYISEGRTATLQMFHFTNFFQQIYVLSVLNMLHTLRFSLQNALYFIMLPFFLVSVLFTFYIQGVPKFKCKTPVPKG
jgi:hypothetical protein